MKKITLILLVLFAITSCEKQTIQPTQQQSTNLINPPLEFQGDYYNGAVVILTVTSDDIIYKNESFKEKFKNFNLTESVSNKRYYIETTMKASVALDDRERFELILNSDNRHNFNELKYNGIKNILTKK